MKKTPPNSRIKRSVTGSEGGQDDMRPEYRFDYRKAKPNRFAAKVADTVTVVLDPDVAAVFNSSESVNDLLRSVIHALPESKRKHTG